MTERVENKGKKRVQTSARKAKADPVQTSARVARAPACPRVPLCLLEVLRNGSQVRVEARGERWALAQHDPMNDAGKAAKPLAARKHKAAAEELLAAAYQELERELQLACVPSAESREALVFTPQKAQGEPVRFAVLDASSVVSSHNPQSFAPDPSYPAEVQERVYDRDPNEQRKVIVGASTLNPAVVLNRSPTPEAGPPLVTSGDRAIVLGGNGRSMMIRRAYLENTPAAAAYREDLLRRAGEFGLKRDDVDKVAHPVLVRVVEGLSSTSPARELSQAVRRYNETMTAALDDKARAVAKARQLSETTIASLGELLAGAGEKSLRELMREQPAAFLSRLEADGIVTPQNRAEWSQGGELTERAKDELEGMFLGRVLGTSQRLATTSAGVLRKVERAVPFLVRVEGVNPSFSRLSTLQGAVDLVNEAAARKYSLEQLLDQGGLFGKRTPDPAAEELARVLLEENQKSVAERFRRWANVAAYDPRQSVMFGKPPTHEEATAALFRRAANPCACEQRHGNPEGWRRSPGGAWSTHDGSTHVLPPIREGGRWFWRVAPAGALARVPRPEAKGEADSAEAAIAAADEARGARAQNPATELRVVVQHVGKSGAGVDLYRPCLALVDLSSNKVRELYSCGDTTKTAIETAVDAAKRLARAQGLVIDAGGLLLEPEGRKANPETRRVAAYLETDADSVRELARALLLGVGSSLEGNTVRIRRPGAHPGLWLRFDDAGRPVEARVDGKRSSGLRKALARQLERYPRTRNPRPRRVAVVWSHPRQDDELQFAPYGKGTLEVQRRNLGMDDSDRRMAWRVWSGENNDGRREKYDGGTADTPADARKAAETSRFLSLLT